MASVKGQKHKSPSLSNKLIRRVHDKTNYNIKDLRHLIPIVFESLAELIMERKVFNIPSFGTFKTKTNKARTMKNNLDGGNALYVPERTKITFTRYINK